MREAVRGAGEGQQTNQEALANLLCIVYLSEFLTAVVISEFSFYSQI